MHLLLDMNKKYSKGGLLLGCVIFGLVEYWKFVSFVKNTLANTLDTTKTTTGTASATYQTSDNNAITAKQLDSCNSNTTLINNKSLRYGGFPRI